MVLEFWDNEPGDQHDEFDDWTSRHPDAFVLNYLADDRAMLHKAVCAKLHGPHQNPSEGKSRTQRRKLCCDDRRFLLLRGAKDTVSIDVCQSCKP